MMTFAQCWCHYTSGQEESTSPSVYTQEYDEDSIHPLTTREIAEAQKQDLTLNTMADKDGHTTQLVENIHVLCKDGKIAILASLQQPAVA